MRLLLFCIFLVAGAIYNVGSFILYVQERWSRSDMEAQRAGISRLHHPEATLAAIRIHIDNDDFSPQVDALIRRALTQVPSFYIPPVYLAVYHANRLEQPVQTYKAFDAAVERYPFNGRLRLDYARWLFAARSFNPPVSVDTSGRFRDRVELAETQLKNALSLEPELTREALGILRRQETPPRRWSEFVPITVDARKQLVLTLAEEGYRREALAVLRSLLDQIDDALYCKQAASWALAWNDPEIALQAIMRWKEIDPKGQRRGIEPHQIGLLTARAYLMLDNTDAAYDAFRAALRNVGPRSNSGLKLLCGMGDEYLRRKQLALAESIYNEATNYSPSYVRALLGLARTHRLLGEPAKAAENYRKALLVDPGNTAAATELDRLTARYESKTMFP
jgi:tetratricopeptide (TPR) repeat protein